MNGEFKYSPGSQDKHIFHQCHTFVVQCLLKKNFHIQTFEIYYICTKKTCLVTALLVRHFLFIVSYGNHNPKGITS